MVYRAKFMYEIYNSKQEFINMFITRPKSRKLYGVSRAEIILVAQMCCQTWWSNVWFSYKIFVRAIPLLWVDAL